jgi:hypothetical protein
MFVSDQPQEKSMPGDLSIKAKIGSKVRCIAIPDMGLWHRTARIEGFFIPEVGRIYRIRGHARSHDEEGNVMRGILLSLEDKEKIIPLKNVEMRDLGEPFFPYHCFNFVSAPP